jgi:hypothetical protein
VTVVPLASVHLVSLSVFKAALKYVEPPRLLLCIALGRYLLWDLFFLFIEILTSYILHFRFILKTMSSDLDYGDSDDDSSYTGPESGDDSADSRDIEDGELREAASEKVAAVDQLSRIPGLTFCPTHKPGQMLEVCLTCRAVLGMVRPSVAKQLLIPNQSTAAVHRYASRSDEQAPSLTLPDSVVELAENVFNSGTYKSKAHWTDLVKKFLTLPPEQHERLVKDLEMEPLFRAYQSDQRFRYVFKYRKELGDALKSLRITQRVIFDVVNVVDGHIPKMRQLGVEAGLAFPDVAPPRENSKVPKQLLNSLAVASTEKLFPLPELSDILEGVSEDIPDDDLAQIKRNWVVLGDELSDYRKSCVDHFVKLFSSAAETANMIDDGFAFYTDMYGHVDASIRELLRSKMANLFKSDYRPDVLGKHKAVASSSRGKEKPLGLLGGEDKVRSVLGEATKQDELLRKTIMPKTSRRGKPGSSRKKSRSRSRSPAGSRYKNNRGGRGKYSGSKSGGRSGYKSWNKKNSKQDRDESDEESPRVSGSKDRPNKSKGKSKGKSGSGNQNKGEFVQPSSFGAAWPNFFSAVALCMVTTIGLAVDIIPALDKLPLAGRISSCVNGWKIICNNSWVCSVVEFGYKIPLKFLPRQFRIPVNPSVSGAAHQVLIDEAIGLKNKAAVSVVEPIKGQYISSYFAVPKPRSPGKFRPILNLKYFNRNVKKIQV